jgi:hypothetical protein
MRRAMSQGMRFLFASAVVAAALPGLRGGEQKPPTRREFMREKLEFSKLVLEGLTVENFDMIAKNSRALRMLSAAAEWEVPTIPNANEYVVFTGEFQRLCEELSKNARDKNIDGATLSYLRLTISCVNCHKYVRFASS